MDLYYREYGQGTPVVILHGLFGFSDNWQTLARALSTSHTVITPDLRNHGRSPHAGTHTYPEMAADVHALLLRNGIYRTAIVGHSMGGKVAMQLALHEPDLIERIAVVDMDPGQSTDNNADVFRALHALDFSKVSTRQEAEEVMKAFIPEQMIRQFLLKNITRNEDGSLAWKMNLPVISRHYADILAAVTGPPFDKPALFVRGSRSNYIKDTDFALIKTLFPQARLETIEGAGHWVHAEKPDEILALLREFLNG
jgi:esterase